MSYLPGPDRAKRTDEAVFCLAAAGASAAATFTAAAAQPTPAVSLGLTGAELALVGAVVSWWMYRWQAARALFLGGLLGLLAAAFWLSQIEQSLSVTEDEPGLILALRMTIPLIAASYVLVRNELAVFALVPGITVFGLAAGQGDEAVARVGFTIFLPLALLAVGYAMMSTGGLSEAGPPRPGHATRLRGPLSWRARHWSTLGGATALTMILAQLIYLPVARWAEEHRWQIIMGMATPGTTLTAETGERTHTTNYPIGRGPIKLRSNPVLSFVGEYAPYWRGQVYDRYLGTAWGRSEAGDPQAELESFPSDGTLAIPCPGLGSSHGLPTHYVETIADLPFTFYAPGQIVLIAAQGPLSLPAATHVIVNGYGIAEVPGSTMRRGTRYAVTSVPLESTRSRHAPPVEDISVRYLNVPFETGRVAELARKLVEGETSPERKLATLTAYLQRNLLYRTDAPAVPPGHDAVDYFLFHQKVGYCDLFASALAMMARSVGIPTRLVTGYAFPTAADTAPGERDSFLFREADGHAWVEAYLPSAGGWVTVEATPAGQEVPTGPGWARATLLRLAILWQNRPLAVVTWVLGALLLLGAAVLLGAKALKRRHLGPQPVEQDARAVVSSVYLKLCHMLRRRGCARRETETPHEYLVTLERWWRSNDRDGALGLSSLRALTEAFVLARYSRVPVTEEQARSAKACLREIREALGRGRRVLAN